MCRLLSSSVWPEANKCGAASARKCRRRLHRAPQQNLMGVSQRRTFPVFAGCLKNGTATSQNLLRNENKPTNKPTKNAPGRFIFSPSPFKSVHVWQLLWGTNVVPTPPYVCGDNSLGLGPPWLRGPKIQKVKKAPVTTSPSRRHLQTLCQSLSRQGTRQTFRATSTPEGIVLC